MSHRYARHAALISLLGLSTVLKAEEIQISLIGHTPGSTVHAELFKLPTEDWESPAFRQLTTREEIRFLAIEPGQYAVRLFVDLNDNGILDSSPRGIPREPVGFSANPNLTRGLPKPADTAFVHQQQNSLLLIRLRQDRRQQTD